MADGHSADGQLSLDVIELGERQKKMLNSVVSMLLCAEAPHSVQHWSGEVRAERPEGLWREVPQLGPGRDWVCEIECRSCASHRPIHSQSGRSARE